MASCSLSGKISGLNSKNAVEDVGPNNLAVRMFDDSAYSYGLYKSAELKWDAQLSAVDLKNGISFQACIGTSAGACDVVGWRDVGTSGSYTFTNLNTLSKSSQATYYTSIRTINKSGYSGPVTTGDGWHPAWKTIQATDFPNGSPMKILKNSAGKIFLVGGFAAYSNVSQLVTGGIKLNSDGSLDSSFPLSGKLYSANNSIMDVQELPSGKILVANHEYYAGEKVGGLFRMNQDGSVDKTFSVGALGFNSIAQTFAVQPDGKIVVAGMFTSINGTAANRIVRLNSDGSVDSSFSTGTGFDNSVQGVALQSDGKILAVGSFLNFNGVSRSYIARLNADGSLDTSFDTLNYLSSGAKQVHVQSDGKILVSGNFTTWNGATQKGIVRLTSTGAKDASFNIGTGFAWGSYGLVTRYQADGKIVVFGDFASYNGTSKKNVARLYQDGTLDTTLDAGTGVYLSGSDSTPQSMRLQADGKILFASPGAATVNGSAYDGVFRLNADGSYDNTFVKPFTFTKGAYTSIPLSNGQVIFLGLNGVTGSTSAPGGILRMNSNLTVDTSFSLAAGIASGTPYGMALMQPDDKIIIAGSYPAYNSGNTAQTLIRMNPDGSYDPSFSVNANAAFTYIKDIYLLPSGKIYVAGSFTTFNGATANAILRLNSDGTTDSTFSSGSGPAGGTIPHVNKIAVQSDGKVLAVGNFTSFNGVSRGYAIRLNTNGSVDTGFTATGVSASWFPSFTELYTVAIFPDGKILLGGWMDTYGGLPNSGGVKVFSDGTIDPSYDLNNGSLLWNQPFTISIQSDSKYFGAGNRRNADATTDYTAPFFYFITTYYQASETEVYVGQSFTGVTDENSMLYSSGHNGIYNFGLLKETD